jgi:hypothetical protein
MRIKRATVVCAVVWLAGVCSSCSQIAAAPSYAADSIGQPVQKYLDLESQPDAYAQKSGRKIESYRTPQGVLVYAVPLSERCVIHWFTDRQAVIIGYRLAGED